MKQSRWASRVHSVRRTSSASKRSRRQYDPDNFFRLNNNISPAS